MSVDMAGIVNDSKIFQVRWKRQYIDIIVPTFLFPLHPNNLELDCSTMFHDGTYVSNRVPGTVESNV